MPPERRSRRSSTPSNAGGQRRCGSRVGPSSGRAAPSVCPISTAHTIRTASPIARRRRHSVLLTQTVACHERHGTSHLNPHGRRGARPPTKGQRASRNAAVGGDGETGAARARFEGQGRRTCVLRSPGSTEPPEPSEGIPSSSARPGSPPVLSIWLVRLAASDPPSPRPFSSVGRNARFVDWGAAPLNDGTRSASKDQDPESR